MAVKIPMDINGFVETPTFVLANRTGNKLGAIPVHNLTFRDSMSDSYESVFTVNKMINGKEFPLWKQLKNFKLAWCRDWDKWFDLTVTLDETTEDIKNVTAKSLSKSELSQVYVYGVECNTEADIQRVDYSASNPTIIYDDEDPNRSLLHKIFKFAPHYRIKHVATSLQRIEKIFSFDGKDVESCLQEIDTELHCIHVDDITSNSDGTIDRAISFYDIESYCMDCGYRGEYRDICPECGKDNVFNGYGEDTGIFVSTKNLSDSISFSSDTDSIKNCFKLEAGDESMTAAIININPNGSQYLWYISEETKEDMPEELRNILDEYNITYDTYNTKHEIAVEEDIVVKYNDMLHSYKSEDESILEMPSTIIGYSNLINHIYDAIDLSLYLESSMMPKIKWPDTTASEQAGMLTSSLLSPIAVKDVSSLKSLMADNAVLSHTKNFVDPRYQVKIKDSNLSGQTWTGVFTVTKYSNPEETAESGSVSILINDNIENYITQQLDRILYDEDEDYPLGISDLFKLELSEFKYKLKEHCMANLVMYKDICQSCIDTLTEQNAGNKTLWNDSADGIYQKIYAPYSLKLKALEDEISVRQMELDSLSDIQTFLYSVRDEIRDKLNMENYIGEDLWKVLLLYRREDTYSNSNYISDGLDNAKLLKNASEFIETAKKELYRSSNLQHSISSSLKNLLVMKEFKPLVNTFMIGNWIHIMVDEELFKLRLLDYEIQFNDLQLINVVFSDVEKTTTGYSSVQDILSKASNMATSYDYVERQASQGSETNKVVNDWFQNGLDSTHIKIIGGADNQTQTWDNHGMLFKRYNALTDSFDDTQLKIINSTIAITNDNWESTETAVGYFLYRDPITNELKDGYGINGNIIIGSLILGESLGIYNDSGSLKFDRNGLNITNGTNTVSINPNSSSLFSVTHGDEKVISLNDDGSANFEGNIHATSLTTSGGVNIGDGAIVYNETDGLSISLLNGYVKDGENLTEKILERAGLISDEIIIGGKNLVLQSNPNADTIDSYLGQYILSEPMLAGVEYTISVCVTPADGVESISAYVSGGESLLDTMEVNGTKKQVVTATFVADYAESMDPETDETNAYIHLYRNPDDASVIGITKLHWIKLEIGNKATDWSPAPEDTMLLIDANDDHIAQIVAGLESTSILSQTEDGYQFTRVWDSYGDEIAGINEKLVWINLSSVYDQESQMDLPAITLGHSETDNKLLITNLEAAFYNGDEKLTSISYEGLTINGDREFRHGNFAWTIHGANDNYGLRRREDGEF